MVGACPVDSRLLKSFANDDAVDAVMPMMALDARADIDRAATIMRCTRLIHQHAILFNGACFAITNIKYKNTNTYTNTNTNAL